MDAITTLLVSIHKDPADETVWLALADALEESGQQEQAELTRTAALLRRLGDGEERRPLEETLIRLINAGVAPCVPQLRNSVGMDLVLIPPGVFAMGALAHVAPPQQDEYPRHEVEITRAFYLCSGPVTQEQYSKVMGENPSYFSSTGEGQHWVANLETSDFPVERVSYDQARAFCGKLSARPSERAAGRIYRLPTEAEWEYACKAGVCLSLFYFGDSLGRSQANYDKYLERTSPVGSYPANAFGLFDMHGNVWEWCADAFDNHYYASSPRRDPAGPTTGHGRVLRGGSWYSTELGCRSSYRGASHSDQVDSDTGFRVACSLPARL